MSNFSSVKKSMICSMCIALCIILPMAFHAFGLGTAFSPMHIPVFICGIVCGWPYGLMCGLTGPILSCLITSMPSVLQLPAMCVELVAYGVISGIISKKLHTKKLYIDLYVALIVAIICGRIVAGITNALLFARNDYSIGLWVSSHLVGTIPGTIIQLIFVPAIIVALMRAHIIPYRYSTSTTKEGDK